MNKQNQVYHEKIISNLDYKTTKDVGFLRQGRTNCINTATFPSNQWTFQLFYNKVNLHILIKAS